MENLVEGGYLGGGGGLGMVWGVRDEIKGKRKGGENWG